MFTRSKVYEETRVYYARSKTKRIHNVVYVVVQREREKREIPDFKIKRFFFFFFFEKETT